MLGERDGLAVEPRVGVARGVAPAGHRDPPEVLAGGTVVVHVAPRCHCHPGRRGRQAERYGPRPVGALGVCHGRRHEGLPEPVLRALVHRAITHDDLGDPGVHGERRLQQGRAGGPAAVLGAREEFQCAAAEMAEHLDLGILIQRVRAQAINIGEPEAGILDRGANRLQGELQFAASGVLGEFGGTDPDHGSLITQRASHGSAIRTVAATCSPRLLVPVTASSTRARRRRRACA